MMKITKRLLVLTVLLIISAIEVLAVKVGPVRFDISVERGTSKTFNLNVIGSKGEYTQNLSIYPSDLSMARNGALSFDIKEKENSAVKWIEVSQKDLTLFEEEKKNVSFSISVPYNAEPGEYYAVIMVEPKEYKSVKSKDHPFGVKMRSRVAVVIVLNVPAGMVPRLKLSWVTFCRIAEISSNTCTFCASLGPLLVTVMV